MKLSACIDIMMKELSIPERIKTVKQGGLPAFEFWSWTNKDIDEIEAAVQETGLQVATFCTKSASLVDARQRTEYLEGLKESIPVAKRLGCDRLITQTGAELIGVPRQEQRDSLIQGLKACAPMLEDHGITLLVEPLNILVNHKGYFLYSSYEAFDMIREVDSPNVRVLYDIYHQQITEGNLIPTIRTNIDLIGHFHVADHPGRTEPGTGEINYGNVFRAIEEVGYEGWVGLEYKPIKSALDTFRELRELVAELA